MATLLFTHNQLYKRWESAAFSPTMSNIEIAVTFKNPGGGHVSVLRSTDGVTFTNFESSTIGNLCQKTKTVIFNISGIVPAAILKLASTTEPQDMSWRE